MILVVDNHDSFVHTLTSYLHELGAQTEIVEADEADTASALSARVSGVMISPGPGTPEAAGASVAIADRAVRARVPLLGVCLGHQALAVACGARVGHATELMHGITSEVHHTGTGLFEGLPQPFAATRYHSLAVDEATLPPALRVTARTPGGVIMGLEHRDAPAFGVQFHPESVLTEGGYRLLGNWLERAGVAGAAGRAQALRPHSPVQ